MRNKGTDNANKRALGLIAAFILCSPARIASFCSLVVSQHTFRASTTHPEAAAIADPTPLASQLSEDRGWSHQAALLWKEEEMTVDVKDAIRIYYLQICAGHVPCAYGPSGRFRRQQTLSKTLRGGPRGSSRL